MRLLNPLVVTAAPPFPAYAATVELKLQCTVTFNVKPLSQGPGEVPIGGDNFAIIKGAAGMRQPSCACPMPRREPPFQARNRLIRLRRSRCGAASLSAGFCWRRLAPIGLYDCSVTCH